MQGWQYRKGLIYLGPIFRLTKLAFLRARATLKGKYKSALCRISSLAFIFVLIPTSSDVWHLHLYIRDPARKN